MNKHISEDIQQCIDDLRDLWPHSRNKMAIQRALNNTVNDYYAWHEKYLNQHRALPKKENNRLLEKSLTLLAQLSVQLAEQSVPWPSPLYFAHMNTDTFIPSGLAYFTTMLYNPNNVTPEASPLTTKLEYELSDAFCRLFGYNPQTAWAHLSSGGHASNYEAIWMARNLKRVPFVIKRIPALAKYLAGISDAGLANVSARKIAGWLKDAKTQNLLPHILENIRQPEYCSLTAKGKLIVANGRHYAWDKCADLLGLELVLINVDDALRMDIGDLAQKMRGYLAAGTPVVAVVATAGSSGEGSVDEIDKIVALRKKTEEETGCSFYIHVDAASGGYYRSLLVEPPRDETPVLTTRHDPGDVLKPQVKRALLALQEVDSVTVDPHKSGYIAYPAGCLAIRDRFYSSVISIQSNYFAQENGMHMDFGPHTLEGARAGASVAAVWMAHRLLGFHNQGYGVLLAGNLISANQLHQMINLTEAVGAERALLLRSLYPPDLNMLNFTLRPAGKVCSTDVMESLNRRFLENIALKNSHQKSLLWLSKNIISEDKLSNGRVKNHRNMTVIRCCVMKNVSEEDLSVFLQQCDSCCDGLSF